MVKLHGLGGLGGLRVYVEVTASESKKGEISQVVTVSNFICCIDGK